MTVEFTGERVVPGQVDVDLWNEHMSRYAFAARLVTGRSVLEVGCGTGYGSAELTGSAASVTAVDIAPDAVASAQARYGNPSLRFTAASATDLPFRPESFDAVIAYEVIEHLEHWPRLIEEARRVLRPEGLFVVSTPNKHFYAETRAQTGPNPYHVHEFEFAEFRGALEAVFPHVSMYLQDHSEGILFHSVSSREPAQAHVARQDAEPAQANFFIALCSTTPQSVPPSWVYIPSAANALREKLRHIERLEGEVRTKDEWLNEAHTRHASLVKEHRQQTEELENSNRWAESLNNKLKDAVQRIVALQDEQQQAAREMSAAYEQQLASINSELESRTRWALENEARLNAQLAEVAADRDKQTADLVACVQILHATEARLDEATRMAASLASERDRLRAILGGARESRWLRVGRAIGIGPELPER